MEPKFKRRYYFPRKLLTWKDLSYLINLRPLMTAERTRFDTEEKYRWINHPWALDENCFPPVLLKDMLDNLLIYFVDMSRCTKKVNAFAERLEKKYDTPVDAHVYVDRCLNDTHPFGIHFDWNHNGGVFSLNTCDGFTVIDGEEIPSVANRMLFFDPSIMHHSTNCTNDPCRMNINFNYF